GRGTDKRPNVGGVYYGTEGKRSVMLAAHLDTMPIGDLSAWTVDPLGGEVRDGKLYGRGSGDNKFGIASGIFLLRALKVLNIQLKQNVVLSAYCDEEYGGGNGSIASCVKYPCDMYINLDGGNSVREIWTCSIGGQVLEAKVAAREPQDSAASVIDGLQVFKGHLEQFGKRRRDELQTHRFYRDSDMQRSALRILSCRCGDAGTNLGRGQMEFVFYTVSERQAIEVELEQMAEAARQDLNAMGLDLAPLVPRSRYFDYICADESEPSIQLLLDCASEIAGKPILPAGACLSDYFLYYKHGSPVSVTYGVLRDFKLPGGAHQPDEFIDCNEFVRHTQSLALFLLRWCG
ncbi:MAG: M20 family metallopeptidase, partial [Clostridiales bacterium]|nr:M20 family metallopeptidase [Clostridiales bacterium]